MKTSMDIDCIEPEQEVQVPEKVRVLSIDIGIISLALCITEFDIENHEFDLVYVEKTSIGTMKQTCQVLAVALIDFMKSSEQVNEKPLDYILIENQVSRSIKNTVLGYACYSYFYTNSQLKDDGSEVRFISPRNKFKAIDSYFPGLLDRYETDHTKSASRDLKKLSVQISKDVFEELNVTKGLESMKEFKKKDDVADVFLQSFGIFLDHNNNSGNPIRQKRKRRRR